MSSLGERSEIRSQAPVDLPRDVTLETADDLPLAEAFLEAPGCVRTGPFAVAQSHHRNHVQSGVRATIAARVQAVPNRLARGGRDRIDTAEVGESSLASDPVDVLSSGHEKLGRVRNPEPEQFKGPRCSILDERTQLTVKFGNLRIECGDAPGEASQRELRRFGGFGEASWIRSKAAAQAGSAAEGLSAGERLAQCRWCGDNEIAELDQGCGPSFQRSLFGDLDLAYRLDDPAGVLRNRRSLAGQHLASRRFGVDGVGFPVPMPHVRVGTVDFQDPDPGLSEHTSELRAVGAAGLDADRFHRPQGR